MPGGSSYKFGRFPFKYNSLIDNYLSVGWPTNAQTKPQLIAALNGMLADAPEVFQSRRLLGEMCSYAYDDSNGMSAPEGLHDDLVMAMGIALVVRGQAKWVTTGMLPVDRGAGLQPARTG